MLFNTRLHSKYVLAETPVLLSKLKKALKTEEAYSILDHIEGADTWVAGGCYLLAKTLMQLVPNAKLVVLMGLTKEQAQQLTEARPNHVLVKVGNYLVDGDGMSSEASLFKRWIKYEGLIGKCWIEPFNPNKHKADYISLANTPSFKKAQLELYAYLKEKLR